MGMAQGEIKDRTEALKYEGGEVRQSAFEVLVKIGGPAVPSLIEALKDEDSDVRQVAASALVKIGESAVPALISLLKDRDERSDVRRIATWILTSIGGLAIPALVDAIRCQDEGVYETATIADAEPEENTIERDAEEAVPPKSKLQVEDLLGKAQSKDRLARPHRMSIAPFSISELKAAPAQAQPGESVTISFKAVNNSDADNYYPVTLRINGVVVGAEVVSLPRRTTLPMKFTTVGTVPGDYRVEINDAAGKFTVIEREIKSKIREPMVPKPEPSVLEVRSKVGRVAVETDLQREKTLNVNVVQESGGLQSAIDKVADYIEFGLDKVGDGITFPFKKMVDTSTTAFKTEDKKAKRRN
jgi:hypothetical protein